MKLNFKDISSQDLYEMCVRGEESAWHYLYNYIRKIIVKKQGRYSEPVDDMAQNVVCHLLNGAIDRVRDKAAFRGFVRRVTVNLLLDDVKKRRILTLSYDQEETPVDMERFDGPQSLFSPEDQSIAGSTVGLIRRVLGQMSEKCRQVLARYMEYQMGGIKNYQELAKIFGEPVGTVSSRINRCLIKLKNRQEIKKIL